MCSKAGVGSRRAPSPPPPPLFYTMCSTLVLSIFYPLPIHPHFGSSINSTVTGVYAARFNPPCRLLQYICVCRQSRVAQPLFYILCVQAVCVLLYGCISARQGSAANTKSGNIQLENSLTHFSSLFSLSCSARSLYIIICMQN